MKSPCWQCPMREIKCHVECQEYQNYAEECERLRQKRSIVGDLYHVSKELLKNLKRKSLQANR